MYRIKAPGVEGVTSEEPPDHQHGPPQKAMPFERLLGKFRTGGDKTASGGEERRDKPPV